MRSRPSQAAGGMSVEEQRLAGPILAAGRFAKMVDRRPDRLLGRRRPPRTFALHGFQKDPQADRMGGDLQHVAGVWEEGQLVVGQAELGAVDDPKRLQRRQQRARRPDPARVPRAHRIKFLRAVENMVTVDGEVSPEERESLILFAQLIR